MNRQPSLHDPAEGSAPLPQQFAFVTVEDADAKAMRSFWRGLVIGGMAAGALAWTLPAFAEVNITGTIIDMQPAPPPAVAEVTMNNWSANGPQDDGTYPLAMPGLAVEIEFTWNVGQIGEDRVTVIPPDGMICDPLDCVMAVPEGQGGRVLLLEWIGG